MKIQAYRIALLFLVLAVTWGIGTFTIAHIERVAVERGSPWFYASGRWVGLIVTFIGPNIYHIVADSILDFVTVTVGEQLLILIVAFLGLPFWRGSDNYLKARELYLLLKSHDEHWTEAWARGERADDWERGDEV